MIKFTRLYNNLSEKMKTKNLTIMFTDIKWFTEKTSTYSRKQIDDFLSIQSSLFEPIIKEFNWTIIKTIWDAYLLAFESPTDAVLCWIKAQEAIENHNNNLEVDKEKEFHIRIWINTWEVNIINWDVFWETVNIASRIETIAEANEIYFTQSVYLSMNKNEIPTASVWYRHLKWIPEEIKVYKVLKECWEIEAYHCQRKHNALENWKINKNDETIVNDSLKDFVENKSNNVLKEKNNKKIIYVFSFILLLWITSTFAFWSKKYFKTNLMDDNNIKVQKEENIYKNENVANINQEVVKKENNYIEEIPDIPDIPEIKDFIDKNIEFGTNNLVKESNSSDVINEELSKITNKDQEFEIKKEFILGHYEMLENKDFVNAISNYDDTVIKDKKLSKELLKKWYENTFSIYVLNFKEIRNNEFTFEVKVEDEDLETTTYYQTTMVLDDSNWNLKISSYESKIIKKE